MEADKVQGRSSPPFVLFVFSLAGWALVNAWFYLLEADIRAYAVVAVPGLILTVLSVLRGSAGKPDDGNGTGRARQTRREVACSVALLFGAGALLGGLVVSGWLLPFAVLALACLCIPWPRFAVGRRHFGWSSTITLCGWLSASVAGHGAVQVMSLLLAGWALWLAVCCALLVQFARERRVARGVKAQPEPAATDV